MRTYTSQTLNNDANIYVGPFGTIAVGYDRLLRVHDNVTPGGQTIKMGALDIVGNIASESTGTGTLVVEGGAGISGNLYIGGGLFVDGVVTSNITAVELAANIIAVGNVVITDASIFVGNTIVDNSTISTYDLTVSNTTISGNIFANSTITSQNLNTTNISTIDLSASNTVIANEIVANSYISTPSVYFNSDYNNGLLTNCGGVISGFALYDNNTGSRTPVVIDTWSSSEYRSAHYFIQVFNTGSDSYQISQLTAMWMGSIAYKSEYNILAPNDRLGEFNVVLDTVNNQVTLTFTPSTSTANAYNIMRTLIPQSELTPPIV